MEDQRTLLAKENERMSIDISMYEMKRVGLVALYKHACFQSNKKEIENIRGHITAIDDHIFDLVFRQMDNIRRIQLL